MVVVTKRIKIGELGRSGKGSVFLIHHLTLRSCYLREGNEPTTKQELLLTQSPEGIVSCQPKVLDGL